MGGRGPGRRLLTSEHEIASSADTAMARERATGTVDLTLRLPERACAGSRLYERPGRDRRINTTVSATAAGPRTQAPARMAIARRLPGAAERTSDASPEGLGEADRGAVVAAGRGPVIGARVG
jgi:hypothetical protein